MSLNNFPNAVGIEWILDNDASSAAVLVASEAHAITLAIEGLLGVVFTVATLTDEAVDVGEVIDAGFSSAMPYSCYSLPGSLLVFIPSFLRTSSLNLPDMSIFLHLIILGKPHISVSQW